MWHAMRFHCPEYFSGWDPLEKKNDEILSQGYENIKNIFDFAMVARKTIIHVHYIKGFFCLQGYCSFARI